jgi:hypothetical protein
VGMHTLVHPGSVAFSGYVLLHLVSGGPAHIGTIRTMTAFINTVRDGAPSSSGPLEVGANQ